LSSPNRYQLNTNQERVGVIAPHQNFIAIGMMSGTSRDGIDVALIETDGEEYVRPIAFESQAYDLETRQLIGEACDLAMAMPDRQKHDLIERCDLHLTELHASILDDLLTASGTSGEAIRVIGFHGHTVAHRADLGWTWQIGSPDFLTARYGVDVVYDLRSNDMLHGGQGAPLLPVYHRAVFGSSEHDVVVLNLGGVANLTWLGKDGSICAFDCGMASALIDDWVQFHYNVAFDESGRIAASGTIDGGVLAQMTNHPFFAAPYPKSIDRADFTLEAVQNLAPADAAATLAAFTARGVAIGLAQLPGTPANLIVTGGGRKNAFIMDLIEQMSSIAPQPTEAHGWDGDAIEAQGFAYMAVRNLRGLPITFPETTGVSVPIIGGTLHRSSSRKEQAAA
jgi:anhydro-N-acetylmuramic acid kinase